MGHGVWGNEFLSLNVGDLEESGLVKGGFAPVHFWVNAVAHFWDNAVVRKMLSYTLGHFGTTLSYTISVSCNAVAP